MSATCCTPPTPATGPGAPAYRRVLWAALVVNAGMFGVETVAGAGARSSALHADALDFLADAANYGISLFVLRAALRTRAGAALLKGMTMLAFGLWVVGRAAYHAVAGTVPEPETMGVVGVLALIANLAVAALLYAYRRGDSNMRSVWLCTRNDALGNVAVLAAASGVFATGRGWPDALVAAVIATLALTGAGQVVRQALGERRHTAAAAVALLVVLVGARDAGAQPAADSATVTVLVRRDTLPIAGAAVRVVDTRIASQTDARGSATLRVPAGDRVLAARALGHSAGTLRLALRAGQDTTVTLALEVHAEEAEAIVVTATRGERRVEDTPLRVEVIDEEEVAEKVSMTPGDIAMMLNETSGLRVQATNPSLGGANVRVQGLRGRYTLLLADGLPLHGGQTGGLGLLQIPPVDLGRVEIVKGAASALHGSSALGGVIDLVSRRPSEEGERTLLLNATSRGGADGVFFGGGPLAERWGYTMLAGAHAQRRNDLDADGWTDMPGYRRVVLRPRLFYDDGSGGTAFLTAGYTGERRDGGTLDGRVAPDGRPHAESLRTGRADVGALARRVLRGDGPLGGAIVTVRGSATEQRHRHRFGEALERDRHTTAFGEAAVAVPRGRATLVGGAAFQLERYRARDVTGFDYTYSTPALFAQADVDPASWIALSASARLDAHSDYGTFVNPRVSALLRRTDVDAPLAGWTARLSAGTGAFAPTPFVEETEVTGLAPLVPRPGVAAERARSASLDVGGPTETPLGTLEVYGTAFGSVVRHPLQVRDAPGVTPSGASRFALVNAPEPTRTWGGELLARLVRELGEERAARLTVTYTYLRATECDPDVVPVRGACPRREVPLNPRHALGVVASVEEEGKGRVGLELYRTGRQTLERNPFRAESRPYLVIGLLAERQVGRARLFVNGENLGDVRQTRVDPLVLPSRGPGGRWTTPVWSLLDGRTINGGVRLGF